MTENWLDDVRQWPPLTDEGIQDYFLHRLACDDQQNANCRALIEGQNYLRSGWVGQILLHRLPDDKHILLKGPVRYSQSISKIHAVEVTLSEEGSVVGVKCDCMANKGKCCSHTAGLLYKIKDAVLKGFTGISCTDRACAWNRSTWKNVVPDTVENICGPEQEPRKCTVVNATAFQTDADVIRHYNSPNLVGLSMIPGTILNYVLTAQPQKKARIDDLPKEHSHCAEHNCKLCNIIFDKHVKCSQDQRKYIEERTKCQSSKFWMDQRKIRITSSEAYEVPKKADSTNWVERKLNSKFFGNAATRHGQLSEPLARKFFEEKTTKTVKTTGLIVDEEENWLGASPDGIIDTDTILEIKCPTLKKLEAHGGSLLRMIEANKYDVRKKNGRYILRETASGLGYYYQVQIAMHCAKRTNCKFLVWTQNEHVIVDVPYNCKWVTDKICHLKTIYFEHLLPAIATRMAHGIMKVKSV